MEASGLHEKKHCMVNEHQGHCVNDKPLDAIHRHCRHGTTVVATLRSEGVEPVISEVHYQDRREGVKANTFIEQVDGEAEEKSDSHQRQWIGFDGKNEEV